jgi:putative sterol carrier protein
MADILSYLEKVKDRFGDPAIRESFKGYTRNFLFEFTDSGESYVLHIANGESATLEKGTLSTADLTITTTTDVVAAIMEKKLNAITAYSTHKFRSRGTMDDLLKLQKLL